MTNHEKAMHLVDKVRAGKLTIAAAEQALEEREMHEVLELFYQELETLHTDTEEDYV